MVVMYEGESGDPLGNSAAPYINRLARAYAYDVDWYGVSHPSLPNYLAVTSGGYWGCRSDACALDSYTENNLGNQLDRADIPWGAYMESMPSDCYARSTSGEYAAKHDPFVYYRDIHSACPDHVLPYPGSAGLLSALDGVDAPDFVWITPNLMDDMHSGTMAEGDAWLRANLAPVLTSGWFSDSASTVIFMMDENNRLPSPAGGLIPMIVISSKARGVGKVSSYGNDYGALRSIEETYGLPLLAGAGNPANGDLLSLFG
jgi:acid phosphatase